MGIEHLLVDREVASFAAVAGFENRLGLKAQVVSGVQVVYEMAAEAGEDRIGAGKRILYLTRNKGPFVRECPGTRCYTCCGYRILHIGSFCTMDCAYCILQSYFHPPVLQYFLNQDKMAEELDALFSRPAITRIGTGEFTDSLIWQWWTDLSQRLITRFGAQNRAVLELKTKTTAIDGFKDLPHNRKTILAWSLNTEAVIHSEERRTASLEARLRAAARVQSWGYPTAFHFDPIIDYPGAGKDYRKVLRSLFSQVDPAGIVWISLGTLRFMPDLKAIIRQRFPASKIPFGEWVTGMDGKMRYFKPLRIAIYRDLMNEIRHLAPRVCVYFCMEDDAVWRSVFGFVPEQRGGLPAMLDQAAADHCGVYPEVGKRGKYP